MTRESHTSLSYVTSHNSGILKNVNPEVPEEELDEDGVPIPNEEGADALGGHQLTQLNGPVIDPTFSGRGPPSTARIPFAKGKKKPVRILFVSISQT